MNASKIRPNERSQDAEALSVRTTLNDTQGSFHLSQWISGHLQLSPDSRLLDLGSGSGDILLQFASGLDCRGLCDAVDISADGLAILREKSKTLCFPLQTHVVDMDLLCDGAVLSGVRDLTHITSIYSLYYSRDAACLLRHLSNRLVPAGVVVVVAPAPGNNATWYAFLKRHGVALPTWIESLGDAFLRDLLLTVAESCFLKSCHHIVDNTVEVNSALRLRDYWRSTTYHSAEADDVVCRAIDAHFETQSTFPIEKKIGLIRMERPRA